MCNNYSLIKGQKAIMEMINALLDNTGNMPPLPGVFPDYAAPIVRETIEGRELRMARWGLPSPAFALEGKKTDPGVTNVRNTTSPHWRRWLGVEHRCLVPFTSFAEPDQAGGTKANHWFAFGEDRPLAFFAGIYVPGWTSVRKLKEGEVTADLYGFLTTEPNAEVAAVHPKAMPAILTQPDEWEAWLRADWSEAKGLQRPLKDGALTVIKVGGKTDGLEDNSASSGLLL